MPQFIMNNPCGWFGMSLYIERITHTSSMHSPSLEKISVTSMPLCPYFLKPNGDFMRLPTCTVCPAAAIGWAPGIGWPLYLSSIGLGSKVSTCDGPPLRNRKMTRFTLGAKCGPAGPAEGEDVLAPRIPAKEVMPKPLPIIIKVSRRDFVRSLGC